MELLTFCDKCKLYKTAQHPCIIGRGNRKAKFLIVGEAPGRKEDELGEPFIGQAGAILNKTLEEFNLDCFITNAVKCRPVNEEGGNRTPTTSEINLCKPLTLEIIYEMQPKVILALGNIALKQLLPIKLQQNLARGRVYYTSAYNCYIVTTYHPAFLLRNQDSMYYKQFLNDFNLVCDVLSRKPCRYIPSKPTSLSNPVDIRKYLESVKQSNLVVMDLETTGLDFLTDKITDISLCIKEGEGVHIAWKDISPHIELLRSILEDEKISKVFHNGKFDIKFLRACGFDVRNFSFDTMLAYHMLTMQFEGSDTSLYKLDTLSYIFTKEGGYKEILEMNIGALQKSLHKPESQEVQSKKENLVTPTKIRKLKKTEEETLDLEDPVKYTEIDSLIQNFDNLVENTIIDTTSCFTQNENAEIVQRILSQFSDIPPLTPERQEQRKRIFTYPRMINSEQKTIKVAKTKKDAENLINIDIQRSDYLLSLLDKEKEYFNKILEDQNLTKLQFYSAMDSDVTFRCYTSLKKQIELEGKSKLFDTLIMPYTQALIRVEENGIMVDLGYIDEMIKCNNKEIDTIIKQFQKLTKSETNLDSPKQLCEILYTKLKLPVLKKTPSGAPSTDEEALKLLYEKTNMEAVKLILKYRELRKQTTTYLEGFKKLTHPLTQRIYPQYLQHTTATGRLSCVNPNLQNVPRDNKIRNMIIPRPGYKLISADLSQMELRILAMISGDRNMINAFKSKVDFHTLTACSMFGIPIEKFSKSDPKHQELRTAAKCVVPETRIPTQTGIFKIGDLCYDYPDVDNFKNIENVYIVDPDGKYTSAVQFYNGGVVKCIQVVLENGMKLTGSYTHKIYVLRDNTIQEVELQNLKEEDIVLLQGGVPNHSNNVLFNYELLKESRVLPPHDSSLFVRLDKSECKLLGYIFSYGVKVGKNLRLIFNTKNEMEECCKFLEAIQIRGYLKHYETVQGQRVYIISFTYDKSFYSLLDSLELLQDNKLPEFVFRVDKHVAAYFLEIVLSKSLTEEGYIEDTSLQLLEDLQSLLFLQYGIITYIKNKADGSYLLYFSSKDKKLIIKEIYDLSLERKVISDILLNQYFNIQFYSVHPYLDYVCMKISHIDYNIVSQVYDLYVPDGNHFNTNGFISHNSINFGIAYQMAPVSLATQLNIPLQQAEEFIQKFYSAYPDVKRWIDDIMKFCMRHGYVETIHGRRRYLPAVFSSDNSTRMRALRQAVNTPIQGTASDCTGFALIKNQDYLDKSKKCAYQVGIIHDCILVECREDDVEDVGNMLIENMTTNIPEISIDLEVDLTITDRWEK